MCVCVCVCVLFIKQKVKKNGEKKQDRVRMVKELHRLHTPVQEAMKIHTKQLNRFRPRISKKKGTFGHLRNLSPLWQKVKKLIFVVKKGSIHRKDAKDILVKQKQFDELP